MELILCMGCCHAGTGLSPFLPVKEVLMLQHTKTLHNCQLPTLWKQYEEEPHLGVMARYLQTFGDIVYNQQYSIAHPESNFYQIGINFKLKISPNNLTCKLTFVSALIPH